MSLLDRLDAPGPKRILALDGGGVRGILSIAFLERIEAILRERFGRNLVLADLYWRNEYRGNHCGSPSGWEERIRNQRHIFQLREPGLRPVGRAPKLGFTK